MKLQNLFQVMIDKNTPHYKTLLVLAYSCLFFLGAATKHLVELINTPTYENLYIMYCFIGLEVFLLTFIYLIYRANN